MIVRQEKATFNQHSVRVGFDYDDATLEVVRFWTEDDNSKGGFAVKLPDSKDGGKIKAEVFAEKDVAVDKITLTVDKDGVLELPFSLESSYQWQ